MEEVDDRLSRLSAMHPGRLRMGDGSEGVIGGLQSQEADHTGEHNQHEKLTRQDRISEARVSKQQKLEREQETIILYESRTSQVIQSVDKHLRLVFQASVTTSRQISSRLFVLRSYTTLNPSEHSVSYVCNVRMARQVFQDARL